ncbi:MAG: hypothetical protein LUQ59_12430, partial [Methanothrix sp.]|nr:hypothetical protein [Methanothrix sp.]
MCLSKGALQESRERQVAGGTPASERYPPALERRYPYKARTSLPVSRRKRLRAISLINPASRSPFA